MNSNTPSDTPPTGTESSLPRIPELATKVYDLLVNIEPAVRRKVLQGVFGMLGDTTEQTITSPVSVKMDSVSEPTRFGPKAMIWIQKNNLTPADLDDVFHVDGGVVDVIGTSPGKGKRERTINAYLLCGARALLATDDTRFSEADAVQLCRKQGCHDAANHSLTRGMFENRIAGSKDSGWTLTNPGQVDAAKLVKSMRAKEAG